MSDIFPTTVNDAGYIAFIVSEATVKIYHIQLGNIISKNSSLAICLLGLPEIQGSFVSLMLIF